MKLFNFVLVLLVSAFVLSCGVKGDPLPPEANPIPKPTPKPAKTKK